MIFNNRYDNLQSTEVKIDRNAKRMDVTLRVNLIYGGAIGLNKKTIKLQEETNGETFSTDEPDPFKNIKSVTISNSPPKDILTSIGNVV
ncbi:hypothetical protein [Flavobacterium sp. PL002]|uniref:hypothetical protein n=1 Tax=Flavobacterium sp. PL002 TaxID=1897058 RepID=UPI001787F243|nr:hypothetical protein [Flavobacterium sp. PL002]MBE0393157.1 hypothetical protein [Flavobacterium sp. PL002]